MSRGTPRNAFSQVIGPAEPEMAELVETADAASRPERFAISSARIASTRPSPVLAIPVARPLSTARAASTASSGIGLAGPPASLTVGAVDLDHLEPAAAQMTSQPSAIGAGPFDPDPLDHTEARPASRAAPRTRPGSSGTTPPPAPRRWRPATAATWASRWVSTPPVTGRVASTMVMAIPSLFNVVKGWHARPVKETVSSRCC